LQHFGSPPIRPTAWSDHSSSTSQLFSSARALGWLRVGLQEQLLVEVYGLALRGDAEEFAGHVHQRAKIALRMIAQRGDQLLGHELGRRGLLQGVFETIAQFIGGEAIESRADADPAGER